MIGDGPGEGAVLLPWRAHCNNIYLMTSHPHQDFDTCRNVGIMEASF